MQRATAVFQCTLPITLHRLPATVFCFSLAPSRRRPFDTDRPTFNTCPLEWDNSPFSGRISICKLERRACVAQEKRNRQESGRQTGNNPAEKLHSQALPMEIAKIPQPTLSCGSFAAHLVSIWCPFGVQLVSDWCPFGSSGSSLRERETHAICSPSGLQLAHRGIGIGAELRRKLESGAHKFAFLATVCQR